MQVESVLLALSAPIIIMLLGGNFYFLKRLVDTIHLTSKEQAYLKTDFKVLSTKFDSALRSLDSVKEEIQTIPQISIDLAVLKERMNSRRENREKAPSIC